MRFRTSARSTTGAPRTAAVSGGALGRHTCEMTGRSPQACANASTASQSVYSKSRRPSGALLELVEVVPGRLAGLVAVIGGGEADGEEGRRTQRECRAVTVARRAAIL